MRTRPDHIPLEDIIDAAARRMTSASPSSAMRARVLEEISVRRRAGIWWRFALAGGGVAGALIVFVLASRPGAPVPRDPRLIASGPAVDSPSSAGSPAPINVAARGAEAAHPTRSDVRTSPLTPVVTARAAAVVVTASETAWRERRVAALSRPDALRVAPLETPATTIEPIGIAPLRVAPLVVPALGDEQNR